ncbi:hypothetical protein AYI68_g4671 [Smittium mucronatum]|uniref:Uncharacterized protein n=1 Tax=Smittium mucronatum TaxID=133383 RepID=A0A1R0GWF5_9FUNG|nr:hypothetical protein AYI68_g4671 [Smittium mucronatum]
MDDPLGKLNGSKIEYLTPSSKIPQQGDLKIHDKISALKSSKKRNVIKKFIRKARESNPFFGPNDPSPLKIPNQSSFTELLTKKSFEVISDHSVPIYHGLSKTQFKELHFSDSESNFGSLLKSQEKRNMPLEPSEYERLINSGASRCITWKNRQSTRLTLFILSVSFLLTILLPEKLVYKFLLLAIGFEFFVLFFLKVKFVRYRKLLLYPEWILWSNKTDLEIAIDLYHKENPLNVRISRLKNYPQSKTAMAWMIGAPVKNHTFMSKQIPDFCPKNRRKNPPKLKKHLSSIEKNKRKKKKIPYIKLDGSHSNLDGRDLDISTHEENINGHQPWLNKRAWKSESHIVREKKGVFRNNTRDSEESSSLQVPPQVVPPGLSSNRLDESDSASKLSPRSLIPELFRRRSSLSSSNTPKRRSAVSDSGVLERSVYDDFSPGSDFQVDLFRKFSPIKPIFGGFVNKIGCYLPLNENFKGYLNKEYVDSISENGISHSIQYEPSFESVSTNNCCWSSEVSVSSVYKSNEAYTYDESTFNRSSPPRSLLGIPETMDEINPHFELPDSPCPDSSSIKLNLDSVSLNSISSSKSDLSKNSRFSNLKNDSMVSNMFKSINKKKDRVVEKSMSSTIEFVNNLKSKFS